MDHKAFQTDPQTTLIAVCFVSLRLPLLYSQSCVKHLRSIFKNKKELILPLRIWLSDTRGIWVLFPHLLSIHIWSPLSFTVQNPLGLLKLSIYWFFLFNQITIPIHDTRGVFPCPRWVLGADRISSTPKCFPFLPLFIFFPFLIGLCFSIRPLTHALCHVL